MKRSVLSLAGIFIILTLCLSCSGNMLAVKPNPMGEQIWQTLLTRDKFLNEAQEEHMAVYREYTMGLPLALGDMLDQKFDSFDVFFQVQIKSSEYALNEGKIIRKLIYASPEIIKRWGSRKKAVKYIEHYIGKNINYIKNNTDTLKGFLLRPGETEKNKILSGNYLTPENKKKFRNGTLTIREVLLNRPESFVHTYALDSFFPPEE